MAKKKYKQSVLEKMIERKTPKGSGLIRPPRQPNGPVIKGDVQQYLREHPELLAASSTSNRQQSELGNTSISNTESSQKQTDLFISLQNEFLDRKLIAQMVMQENLDELEDLWAHRILRIQYREDATAVLAKLRFLRGVDTYELPLHMLADNENVLGFEVLEDANNLSYTAMKPDATNYPGQLEGDKRAIEMTRTIRDGQARFRNMLLSHYGCMCMVTGEKLDAVIEAAHISPYDGNKSNDIGNGLLLRVDIHRLFDRNLLAIEPNSLTIHLHPTLKGSSYSNLDGKKLLIHQKTLIDLKKLGERFKLFRCHSTLQ